MTVATNTTPMTTHERRSRANVLLHVAVCAPATAEEIVELGGGDPSDVAADLEALTQSGAVRRGGAGLQATDPASVLTQADPAEVQEIHDLVLRDLTAGHRVPRASTLHALSESGCSDHRLLEIVIRAVNDDSTDARLLAVLESLGSSLGLDLHAQQLLRAEAAASRGSSSLALSLTDDLLAAPDPTARRAALLAASVHTQNGRLERAAVLYRHLGPDAIGDAATWGVMSAVGLGDVPAAREWRSVMGETGLTYHASGLADLADGLLESLEGSGERSLDLLARAATALTSLDGAATLPDTPASLAALVALHRGEAATADIVLGRALDSGLGGAPGRRRHLLLSAWAAMSQGDLDEAAERIAEVGPAAELAGRDAFLLMGLRAGLARRRSDHSTTRATWREIRGHLLGASIDLYDLLPLGEMLVVAARVGDVERMRPMLRDAMTLLRRLGDPAAWSASLHWSGIQAAFLSEDPAALVPHAEALTGAAEHSRYADALATAGQTWLAVVRGDAETEAVEQAVGLLVDVGHRWDASRLAGHAASRGRDRESALGLMQLARNVNAGRSRQQRDTDRSTPSVLTERELDVARLVLAGQGYRAIGERLFISPKTVEHHVARIRRRLGADSRAQLLAMLRTLVTDLDGGS